MSIYSWIFWGVIVLIPVGLLAAAIKGIFFNKLPEWVNLTGQSYIDWKKGKTGDSKPDND